MYRNSFIVYDLETGGLVTEGECSPITEFATCVLDNDLNDVMESDFFIKPYVDRSLYTPKALSVSNISLELCEKEGLTAEASAKKIVDILNSAKSGGKKPVLVGHNIDSFDNVILDHFLTKMGYNLSDYVETDFTIDTKWWGRMSYPDLSGYRLADCLTMESIDNEMAHRAIGDTRANKELFVKMMRRLRGQESRTSEAISKFRKSFRFQIKK